MKSWYQFSSMLTVAALFASATAVGQVTPWGSAPPAGAAAQIASGVALTSCQNGNCGVTAGTPAYGYGGQAYEHARATAHRSSLRITVPPPPRRLRPTALPSTPLRP